MSTSERRARTGAEWIVFAIACAVLAAVTALVVVAAIVDDEAARPVVAQLGEPRAEGDRYLVDADVRNEGDRTATAVEVVGDLTIGDETHSGTVTIDLLPGGANATATFAFPDDPADGELVIRIGGFTTP
jgi:uncharacterized protein (TIGR02588 family)